MKNFFTLTLCFLTLSLTAQSPVVGDYFEGGVVFWVNPDDNHQGLVCDISDLNTSSSIDSGDQPAWGDSYVIPGASATSIGSGMQNTLDILAAFSQSGIAAELCFNSVNGGYNDWYLPSYDEAVELIDNYDIINSISLANGGTTLLLGESYWTSTQVSAHLAWKINFNNSWVLDGGGKPTPNYVRAVRSYSFVPTPGCTDLNSSNYDSDATEDDGSCLYTGCMDSTACNFNPDATEDDGNCDYSCCPGPGCCDEGTYWNVDTQTCLLDITFCSWQPDSNADGNIGIGDLLDLLSVFGDTDYDEDGVFDSVDDCVDTAACNYQANPTEPCYYIDVLGICGGGCEADEDGDAICDDIDDCIGVVDECGVCNGPGATEVVIDNITILYDSVYLPQLEEWYVYEFGADTLFNYTCAPNCGDLVSHQGYDYSTVQIGDQCWFAENLRTENYRNGDLIDSGLSDEQWEATTNGATCVYGESANCFNEFSAGFDVCNTVQSLSEYGRLYNWHVISDTRGICPTNWHVSSDDEWIELETFLGMSLDDALSTGWRGNVEGSQLKAQEGWYENGNGSNSTGFNGLPGGGRYPQVGFVFGGNYSYWWTSSESNSNDAYYRFMANFHDGIGRGDPSYQYGYSVRCIKD